MRIGQSRQGRYLERFYDFFPTPPVMYPMSYKLVHAVVLSNDSLYVFVLVYIS